MAPKMEEDDDEEEYEDEYELDSEELQYEEMYSQVGYFIANYSTAELGITALLAILSNFQDLEAFHILTKGMDAKVKIQRLKELTKERRLIDEDGALNIRLSHFYDKTADLRNKVAHTWLIKSKGDPLRILFSNIAKLPSELFNMRKQTRHKPDGILADALYEHSDWLHHFTEDIMTLMKPARDSVQKPKKGTKLELKKPRSLEPAAFLLRLQKLEIRAKDRMRKQSPPKT